jgi:predicted ferric reductase
MYRSHREVAVAGYVLLLAHVAVVPWRLESPGGTPSGLIAFAGFTALVVLSIGPRMPGLRRLVILSYHRWRWSHRFIGFFFIFSLAHALLVDGVVRSAPVPLAFLLAAYVIGVLAYAYCLLLARFVRPRRRYVVEAVRRLSETAVEVTLRPRRKPIIFRSGQFAFTRYRQRGLREPHPFTISSPPGEPTLRLTIKELGDYTRRLGTELQPGRTAIVEGGYGMLDYRVGRARQIWVAGGIGVTPFLSWLRDLPHPEPRDIQFFYAVRHRAEAICWEDVLAARTHHIGLNAHLHVSSEAGTLTVDQIMQNTGPVTDAEIYLCGQQPMIAALERGFRHHGVPARAIHFEEFAFR